jgi:hypothetical protein
VTKGNFYITLKWNGIVGTNWEILFHQIETKCSSIDNITTFSLLMKVTISHSHPFFKILSGLIFQGRIGERMWL